MLAFVPLSSYVVSVIAITYGFLGYRGGEGKEEEVGGESQEVGGIEVGPALSCVPFFCEFVVVWVCAAFLASGSLFRDFVFLQQQRRRTKVSLFFSSALRWSFWSFYFFS